MGILSRIQNYVFPTNYPVVGVGRDNQNVAPEKNLRSYITPVQLARLRTDVQMWRDAVAEAENAWFPHRVRMQRMFNDTILNGHTLACMKRRKQLTLLRGWCIKDSSGVENEVVTKLLNKKWFALFLEYALDARFFGYSLIPLGDLVENEFPDISIIRRFNISPDRLNVTSYIYAISGAPFLDEPYKDWHVWVATSTEIGVSKVGYGLLYNVAMYEIICRNVLGFNADYAELYGMPVRVGTTQKTEEDERRNFENALAHMGSAGYILKDILDEVELMETKGTGAGFKVYESLEKRCEAKISKLILGHADALDSTPGKLGTSGEESPQVRALKDTQMEDGAFLEDVINNSLLPKLRVLGLSIPEGVKFCFSNNQELVENRQKEDANNKVTADIALVMANAGLKMDAAYFEERTGIKCSEVEKVEDLKEGVAKVKNKLELLYGDY